MADADSAAVLRHARVLFGAGAVGAATDGQLLERFNTRGEGGAEADAAEAAFAVLLARHGPMVLGVCRRALRDPADVADAFQATFLVLLRKAGSVRVDDSLGRWLYGVSRKVASRARSDAARRERVTAQLSSDPVIPPHDPERRAARSARRGSGPAPRAVPVGGRALRPRRPVARGGGASARLSGGDHREPAFPGSKAAPRTADPPRPRAFGGCARAGSGSPRGTGGVVRVDRSGRLHGRVARVGGFLSH